MPMTSLDRAVQPAVAVPILGMHRSGTSMFTRALNLLGVELGGPLMPPQKDNPKGFWENEFFWAVDVKILQALGRHPSGYGDAKSLDDLPDICSGVSLSEEDVDAIGEYVQRTFGGSDRWGWKDPRSVLLFPLWLRLLVDLGQRDIRPTVITRHPLACTRSLLGRGDLEPLARQLSLDPAALAMDMWKAYTRVLVAVSEETGCYVGTHEWLMDSDRATAELQRVAAYLDLGPVDLSPALEWLDPTSVHNRSPGDGEEWRGSDPEALELYDLLVSRAESQRRVWSETVEADRLRAAGP